MSRLSVSYVIPCDYRIITTMMSRLLFPSLTLVHLLRGTFTECSFHSENQILISVDAHSSFMCVAASHHPPSTTHTRKKTEPTTAAATTQQKNREKKHKEKITMAIAIVYQ